MSSKIAVEVTKLSVQDPKIFRHYLRQNFCMTGNL